MIRMFSSSPPPMDDGLDEEDEEFGDFGTFSVGGVTNSVSFSEFDTPTTFNQMQALNATSPPAINHSKGLMGAPDSGNKANGHVGKPDHIIDESNAVGRPDHIIDQFKDESTAESIAGSHSQTLTNGFQGTSAPFSHDDEDFADFAAFSDKAQAKCETGDEQSEEEHHAVKHQTANSNRTDTEFANFAAFSTYDTQSDTVHCQRDDEASQTQHSAPNRTEPELADFDTFPKHCTLQNHVTGSEITEGSLCKDQDPAKASEDCISLNGNASDLALETDNPECSKPSTVTLNGSADRDCGSETETETSLGRPLSTEALEEFGDMSTTGSVPSPPFQEETATPTGDEDFTDFGDCLTTTEFGNFEQNQEQNAQEHDKEEADDFGDLNPPKFNLDNKTEWSNPESFIQVSSEPQSVRTAPDQDQDQNQDLDQQEDEDFGDFGDFNSLPPQDDDAQVELPSSESFGNFNTVEEEEQEEECGWSAFGDEQASGGGEAEGESWAAFSSQEVTEEPVTSLSSIASRSERLEKLFVSSFPQISSPSVDEQTTTLQHLLEPDSTQGQSPVCVQVWAQLLDIHEALGLRFQWGGSFCNKALLCSLGIDTRNILFTGQKKQPVIVPMYAAGLGMLEPVKPVSAAEMIASIAHSSPCSAESVQEALPPVQFDWSSSGLTNPLDGVDPELFELTTAKLDSNKVNDAFAKLMSTVHTTSTSTARRPQREENLSEEALRVISKFPDLSFMTAKVLMFPATLTPRGVELGAEPEEQAAAAD